MDGISNSLELIRIKMTLLPILCFRCFLSTFSSNANIALYEYEHIPKFVSLDRAYSYIYIRKTNIILLVTYT